MKISRIRLDNFRQFYGKQELELATGKRKNVTLIHAENGFGKTTILNAVLWALFRQVTKKFEQPDKIVNFEAADGGANTASVDVEFNFKEKDYRVTRYFDQTQTGRDKTKLAAYRIDRGISKILDAPESFVASVVPPEMAKYFFFDGEAAESFSSATNLNEIGEAIRNILGCALADTATHDLKELTKQIDKAIGQVPGNDRLTEIENDLQKVTEEEESYVELKKQLEGEISTYTVQRDQILEKLRKAEGAKQIQENRENLQRELRQVEADIVTVQQDIIRWIGQRGVQVVCRKLAQETLDFIDEASLKGRIPSPYNEEFVKGLLNDGTCICNRNLAAGSKEWKAVASLLKNASNAEIMGRVVRARARTQLLREEATEAPGVLTALQSRLALLMGNRTKLEQKIGELGKELESLPLTEIAEREKSRYALDQKILKKGQDLGGVKGKLNSLSIDKKRLEQDLDIVGRKSKGAQKLLYRRNLLVRSVSLLAGLLGQYEDEARRIIQGEINEILKVVAHRDYTCRINPNFSIELTFADGRPTPKSSGENQLLSLVFIASLIKFAASRIEDATLILKPGTVAPLVLDAPFGQLDESYREDTARYIPKLAEQVVLLVSSSQGDEKVLEVLRPHIGAEYVLISENKGSREGKRDTSIVIDGKRYTCSLFNQPRNMTRIERII